MSDFTTTTNFALKKPTVGQAVDLWGTYINSNFDEIDSQLQTLTVSIQTPDLEELGNVLNTTPATNDFLRFNGESWAAATVSIPSSIDDLSDVDISTTAPSTGQALVWSGSKWSPSTPTAATIADGSISTAKLDTGLQTQIGRILVTDDDDSPTNGQILQYNTTDSEWKYADLPGSTVVTLGDVDSAALADNALLVYNSTAGEFQFESGATLRSTLGVDAAGTDNSTDISISSATSYDYITLSSGQVLTINQVNLGTDVTGTLPVAHGGTGGTTASAARTALGLGTISTQDSDDVTITGGNISGIVDLAIADGGTGASSVGAARTNLGVSIGSDVQAWDQQLDDISALAVTDGNIIVGNGTTWVAESGATARASLGLTIGTDVEAYSSTNADYSDTTANFTGTLQNGGSNVVVDSDIGSSVQAYDADTAKYDDTTANFTGTLQNGGSNVLVDSDIGSTVQAAGSYLSDVVSDTTPQLGGNLDVNGNSIVSVSAGNISITPDTTGKIVLDGLSWPTADGSANQVLKTDGAGNLSFVDQSGGGGSGSGYIEHSSTVSDSLAISSGTNRMYIGNTTFSGSGTMGGYLVLSHGYANFTGASALNVTGTLNVVS